MRKAVLRNSTKFTGKHLCQKETLAQMFSCKFCEISNNTLFTEHLRMNGSVNDHQTSFVKNVHSIIYVTGLRHSY